MRDDDRAVVTLIYGEDGNEAEAKEIGQAMLDVDDDLEVEIHEGDQPVYPYLISVE